MIDMGRFFSISNSFVIISNSVMRKLLTNRTIKTGYQLLTLEKRSTKHGFTNLRITVLLCDIFTTEESRFIENTH